MIGGKVVMVRTLIEMCGCGLERVVIAHCPLRCMVTVIESENGWSTGCCLPLVDSLEGVLETVVFSIA